MRHPASPEDTTQAPVDTPITLGAEQYRNAQVFAERIRIAFVLITIGILLSAATDLVFLRGTRPAVHAVQLAQLSLMVTLYAIARRVPPERATALALIGMCVLCAGIAAAGIATDDDSTAPLLLVALTMGCAILLPGTIAFQVSIVAVAAGALLWNMSAVAGPVDLQAKYPTLVAVALAFASSVYIAFRLDRMRVAAVRMAAAQHAAERALRQAHDDLERRVEERTVELRRVNAALEMHIAERMRAEEEARQHQAELAHFARVSSVGQMAAEVAHEINQPLAAIAGFAQGCARRLRAGRDSTAELLPIVDEIIGQALRAGEIIRRLTSFARKREASFAARDLEPLIRGVCQFMEPEARRRGLDVRIDVPSDLRRVEVDRVQIEQVIVNLFKNACEATRRDDRGRREVCITAVMAEPNRVEVTVRDAGDGMTPEVAAHAFDPFFTTKSDGLGVGLSISRSIVEAHGGELWAVTNPDHGTTFHFTLPVAQSPVDSTIATGA